MGRGSDVRNRMMIARRDFVKAGGSAFLGGALLQACDSESGDPGEGQTAGGSKGLEAPQLAELVRSGELPPVEERLPENPLVVEPIEQIGVYGGEWVTAFHVGAPGFAYLMTKVGYDPLVRWDPEWKNVIPNIAERFEVNDEGTEYTFHLRRGIKWSDGEPFTADDIVFAYEDVMNNAELSPAGPAGFFVSGGSPGTLEQLDEYTVKFVFTAPNGLLLQNLATLAGLNLVNKPRHYLTTFHADHNPEVGQLVGESDFSEWFELFANRADFTANPELPTIRGWIFTATPAEAQRLVVERNPYYWKTDPDGSQLPYIDKVTFVRFTSLESLLLAVLNGEFHMHAEEFYTLQNRPIVARESERAGYRVFDMVPATMNSMMLALNLTHQDEVLRNIFSNKDFRIGLSHAINRQEIIDTVYLQQGEPWQASPRPESELLDEELAKQYTQYDVDLANEHLDRVLPDRDGDGFRLRPDGQRFSFSVEVPGDTWADHTDVLELVEQHWREVGVEMSIRFEARTLFVERRNANLHDAVTWHGNGGIDVILDPKWYFPFNDESAYGVPWAQWRTSSGQEGEEPPESVQTQISLYDQIGATPDAQEQNALMKQLLEIAREEFYVMGINLSPFLYGVVKNDFRNFPETMPRGWLYPTPGPTNPEQYFIASE